MAEFEDLRKFVPNTFKPAGFSDELLLDYARAQSAENELWLFQFPPQISTEDFSRSGLKIPQRTKLTAAGKHVYIGSFVVNGVKYNLHEASSEGISNIVNFWTSAEDAAQGQVFRGKPFHRFFVATIEVAPNLTGARAVIDRMPLGFNKPFEPSPMLMPVGLDNPWDGGKLPNGKKKNANITNQLKETPFQFTSGDFQATEALNKLWATPDTAGVPSQPKNKAQASSVKSDKQQTAPRAKKSDVEQLAAVKSKQGSKAQTETHATPAKALATAKAISTPAKSVQTPAVVSNTPAKPVKAAPVPAEDESLQGQSSKKKARTNNPTEGLAGDQLVTLTDSRADSKQSKKDKKEKKEKKSKK